MNQTKNGQTNFTVNEKLSEIERVYDNYISSLNLNFKKNDEIELYLNLTYDQIKSMDPEDLDIASMMLARHAIYVQEQFNKHSRVMNWADSNINRIAAQKWNSFNDKYMPAQERRILATVDDIAAMKYVEIRDEAKGNVDALNFMSQRLEFYSNRFTELKRTKLQKGRI